MGANSKIEWCDHTFNPWTGCTKVSAGCAHCYAESWSKRSGVVQWGADGTRRRTSEQNWQQPLKWNRAAQAEGVRRRVFCASLADVFEDREELVPWRYQLFTLIDQTEWLDWLLLTKRPENFPSLLGEAWYSDGPRENVWLGTSVENQAAANERIPHLLDVTAAVRFLSCEPLLGGVCLPLLSRLDWVIVGGESGRGARPCKVEWIRSVRDQCRAVGVACLIKQLGAAPVDADGFDILLHDSKGGDWSEWPRDLRVREFPQP